MVGFIRLWDFNYGCFFFFFITRYQCHLILFPNEISMMVGFVWLRDLSDGRFSVSVGFFCYMISNTVGFVSLFFYEISKTVGFIRLWDLNYGCFCLVTRSQCQSVFICSFTRFQRQLVLFLCEFSMVVGFIRLWDFNYSCFLFLFHYKISMSLGFVPNQISMMVGFIWVWDLNDGRFSVSIVFFFCYIILNTVGFVSLFIYESTDKWRRPLWTRRSRTISLVVELHLWRLRPCLLDH